jgi:thiamine-phosphate pyrophosphorylase
LNKIGFSLLLITDGWDAQTASRVARALDALPRGVAAVELRAKALSGRAFSEAASALVRVTHARGAPLLVNDRADVALLAGAAGVHLPARGLPSKAARRLVGPERLIGASTHSLDEAEMAVAGGADYVTFGPVWPTPSKAAFGPPLGLSALARATEALPVPVFALGGIDPARAAECRRVGAKVACIGAVLGARDEVNGPAEGARLLAAALGLS